MLEGKEIPIKIGHLTTTIYQIEQWCRIVRLALVEVGEYETIKLSPGIAEAFRDPRPPVVFADCEPPYKIVAPTEVPVDAGPLSPDPLDLPKPGTSPGKGPDH